MELREIGESEVSKHRCPTCTQSVYTGAEICLACGNNARADGGDAIRTPTAFM